MYGLERILVQDFRNIGLADLSLAPGVNCICGDNGQGKTNLLDAIYFLSMTKSSTSAADSFCVRHGCKSFSIAGHYGSNANDSSHDVVCLSYADGTKSIKLNGKPLARISTHIGKFPLVMVSPRDSALVSDAPDDRRRFVNSVLCQTDAQYMACLQSYNRLLAERNRLLKDGASDESLFDVLEMQMARQAVYVQEKRQELAILLNDTAQRHYSALSSDAEEVSMKYCPDCPDADFEKTWKNCRQRDALLHYTTKGIHRDDFLFSMDGYPIRRCGSQGQQKSYIVALKFAQYDIMKGIYSFPPILLLDDVFDKLDSKRVSNLLETVGKSPFGQIFISDTSRARIEECVEGLGGETAFFSAVNGEFVKEQ